MSERHLPGDICPLCEQKILTAHPELQNAWRVIKEKFPDCHISWAWRDQGSQDTFYALGNSRVRWPDSPHNRMAGGLPCADAIDFFQLTPDGLARWRRDYFQQIHAFVMVSGLPVEWGGSWVRFQDNPHFQRKRGPVV